jgi:DNA (cytosine-5)-methyltransferase 1
VENVAALLGRGVGQLLGDLATLRYDAEWHCIRATTFGYPHERDRIWIVAYPSIFRREEGIWHPEGWGRRLWDRLRNRPSSWAIAANDDEIRSRFLRIVDGLPDRVDRLGGLGNAVIPEQVEMIARSVMEITA